MIYEDTSAVLITHNFGASSPTPLPMGLALLCCPLKVQTLLSQVLEQVEDRSSSATLITSGPVSHLIRVLISQKSLLPEILQLGLGPYIISYLLCRGSWFCIYVGLVQATLLLKVHVSYSLIIYRRHYLAADALVSWIL